MYDDILLPVAPESTAARAIPHAASLAERYGATVHVVAAVNVMEETLRGPRAGMLAERVESAAHDRVDSVTDELVSEGVEVRSDVVRGSPHVAIVEAIDETGADLVVMPTHNREGLSRLLLGSVTEKVVRTSPVPVISVPMKGRAD